MSSQAVSEITGKNKDILFHSVNINYDEFKTGRLAWDYEAFMDIVGLSMDEIRSIAADVYVGNTPLVELHNINRLVRSISDPGKGARIFLKDEANNPTGSFKDRRALLPVYEAKRAGYPGVIASTSGNYGAAVASQAARRGLKAIICQEVYDNAGNGQPESLEKGVRARHTAPRSSNIPSGRKYLHTSSSNCSMTSDTSARPSISHSASPESRPSAWRSWSRQKH